MVTKEDTSNLKLKQIVDNIINYKKRAGIQMNHWYREGNQVADFLAELASSNDQI